MSRTRPFDAAIALGAAALVLIFSTQWTGLQPQLRLLTENFPDWKAWAIFAAAFALGISKKAGPIAILQATSTRHSKFGNVAFADGHAAATMTWKDWTDLENTYTKGVKAGITDKVHYTIPMP